MRSAPYLYNATRYFSQLANGGWSISWQRCPMPDHSPCQIIPHPLAQSASAPGGCKIFYDSLFSTLLLAAFIEWETEIRQAGEVERQCRNGWYLTRRLAMSVASQVPIIFGFGTWCNSFARDISIGFKCWLDLQRPLLGIEHEERNNKVFSDHFSRRSIDSRNHAIYPSRLENKSDLHTSPSWWSQSDMTNKQTNKQTNKATRVRQVFYKYFVVGWVCM